MMTALAIPPASQSVCSPYRPPVRSTSWSIVVMSLAPVAPKVRRMCKWIVDETCDPAFVLPLWRRPAAAAA